MANRRLVWVDVAKGLTILMVVLHHAIYYLNEAGWSDPLLVSGTAALRTFRMPLFFFASGLFFESNLRRPWQEFVRTRVGRLLYLYLVWYLIATVFFSTVQWKTYDAASTTVLTPLLTPNNWLWFLYALTLYMGLTWLLSLAPLGLQVGFAVVLTVLFTTGLVSTEGFLWATILGDYVYFFLAVHLRPVALAIAQRQSRALLALAIAGWAGLGAVAFTLDLGAVSPAAFPMAILGVTAAIIGASMLAATWAGALFAWLGQRTLPVFILHMFIVRAVAEFIPQGTEQPRPLIWLVVGAATILSVTISLGLWALSRPVPGLFTAPWDPKGGPTPTSLSALLDQSASSAPGTAGALGPDTGRGE